MINKTTLEQAFEQYWEDRQLKLKAGLMNIADTAAANVRNDFATAKSAMAKDIQAFYSKYSSDNGAVNMADVKNIRLSASELKDFKADIDGYIKAGRNSPYPADWQHQLVQYRSKQSISRMDALLALLQAQAQLLYAGYRSDTKTALRSVYAQGYYRQIYELEQGTRYKLDFNRLSDKDISQAIQAPDPTTGRPTDDRINLGLQALILAQVLQTQRSFTRGSPMSETLTTTVDNPMASAANMSEQVIVSMSSLLASNASFEAYEQPVAEDSHGNPVLSDSTDSEAYDNDGLLKVGTSAIDESGNDDGGADVVQGGKPLFGKYYFVATLDEKTCDVCGGMDTDSHDAGGWPNSEKEPGINAPFMHQNCRCATAPVIPNLDKYVSAEWAAHARASRNAETGKSIWVPSKTYGQWADMNNIPKNALQ